MKIQEFATLVTKAEGGKKEVTVAQVSEILKVINKELWGIPYALIKMKRLGGKIVKLAVLMLVVAAPASAQMEFMFDATKSVAAENYAWDFGDGETSDQAIVVHRYAAPGNYKVKLTVTNQGCAEGVAEQEVIAS